MVGEWGKFKDEIARSRDLGKIVEFWWRDDDACRPEPALECLYALAARTGVPLAVAAVPDRSEASAFASLPRNASVLQHGVDHRNRAANSEKKTEFSADEPLHEAIERLTAGLARLQGVTGGSALPVLVPPWNRICSRLTHHLGSAGYTGLSTFGVRNITNPPAGLIQVNTHLDIIDWKGGREFCGVERALAQAVAHLKARRTAPCDLEGPIGWLTHHAVHDSAAWDFLERLFDVTCDGAQTTWRSAGSLFGLGPAFRPNSA